MEWSTTTEAIPILLFNCYRKIGYKNPGKYCTGSCIYKLIFWDRPPSWIWQEIIKPIRCQLGNNWQQQSKWWLSKRLNKIYFCINEVNNNITCRGLTRRCPQNMLDIVNEYSRKWRINWCRKIVCARISFQQTIMKFKQYIVFKEWYTSFTRHM